MSLSRRPKTVLPALFAGCLGWFAACEDASEAAPAAAGAGGANAGASASKAADGGNGAKGGSVGQAAGSGAKASGGPTRNVTIHFRAVVADRDFSCLETFAGMGATAVAASAADFRFYVQDLKLIDAAGKLVPVTLDARKPWQTPEVALIDFENAQGSCHGTPETNGEITGSVPAGDYKGVVFTNGVPEELNHREQSTQPAPLDVTDLYWAWLTGYRFFVAEMRQGDKGNATGSDDAGVALPGIGLLHIGSTACRKDVGCTKPNRNEIRLANFDPDADVIVADLAAVFGGTDLGQDMQCHSSGAACAPMFERAGVSWETGKSLSDSQKVYRVQKAQTGQGGK